MPDFSLSFDNRMEPQFSSSESIGEKAEIMKALFLITEPDHEKNVDDVIEILNYDLLFDNNQSDEVQSSSSESEDETTLKEEGPWCEQKFMFHRKLIGRDKKIKFQGEILAPLLMVPQSEETRKEYYINDSIIIMLCSMLLMLSSNCLRRDPVNFTQSDYLTHGDCFSFKQEDIVHFRRCIFLDIYCGRLHKKND
ncbi:hypothetical protein ES332_D02G015800v1 [Gossypium tomentosum]|uniref:Uncharacterized protein n=1 Tax=Gossypium tomentosum TaxID=34277 RepID=A0A5D2LQX5_GOSTO|nr:hypothetical protein ES332_D02G015800v1 [Gossypium tomentosum]